MSACILFGHRFTLMRGAGQFKDAEFLVCEACGKTIPVTEDQTRHTQVTWATPADALVDLDK